MKVYCVNCEYIVSPYCGDYGRFCHYPDNKKETYLSEEVVGSKHTPKELNFANHCGWYKEKK